MSKLAYVESNLQKNFLRTATSFVKFWVRRRVHNVDPTKIMVFIWTKDKDVADKNGRICFGKVNFQKKVFTWKCQLAFNIDLD